MGGIGEASCSGFVSGIWGLTAQVVAVTLSGGVAVLLGAKVTWEVMATLIRCRLMVALVLRRLAVVPSCVAVTSGWLVRPPGRVGGLSVVVKVLHGSEEVEVSEIYSSDREYITKAIGLVAWAVGMQGVKPVCQRGAVVGVEAAEKFGVALVV